jgi:hypothetical protein
MRGLVSAAATPLRIRAELERPAPDAVLEWRFDELERCGVDGVDAVALALAPAFDVASLRSLVRRGCPAALAVQILR